MKQLKLSLRQLETIVSEEIRRGKRPDLVVKELTKRGWPEAAARRFVNNSQRMQAITQQSVLARQEQLPQTSQAGSAWLWFVAVVGLAAAVIHLLF